MHKEGLKDLQPKKLIQKPNHSKQTHKTNTTLNWTNQKFNPNPESNTIISVYRNLNHRLYEKSAAAIKFNTVLIHNILTAVDTDEQNTNKPTQQW